MSTQHFFTASFKWKPLPPGIDPDGVGKMFRVRRDTPCNCICGSPDGPCGSCSHNHSAVSECAKRCENNIRTLVNKCVNCQKGHWYEVRLSKYYLFTKNFNKMIRKIKPSGGN